MSLKRTSQNMMKISVKTAVGVAMLVVLVVLARNGYKFGQAVFSEEGYEAKPGTDVTISFTGNESKMDIAEKLEEEGVIRDKLVFYIQELFYTSGKSVNKEKYKITAGDYIVNSSQSGEEIIDILFRTPADSAEGN